MAEKATIDYPANNNIYGMLQDVDGDFWNTSSSAFEAVSEANWANYDIVATEATNTQHYQMTIPAALAGIYSTNFRLRAGGTAAIEDIPIGTTPPFLWNGSTVVDNQNVDGITFESLMEILLSTLSGVTSASVANKISFMKRDGSTSKITVTYGDDDGERTASTIDN